MATVRQSHALNDQLGKLSISENAAAASESRSATSATTSSGDTDGYRSSSDSQLMSRRDDVMSTYQWDYGDELDDEDEEEDDRFDDGYELYEGAPARTHVFLPPPHLGGYLGAPPAPEPQGYVPWGHPPHPVLVIPYQKPGPYQPMPPAGGHNFPNSGHSYPPTGHSYPPEGHRYPPAGHSYQPEGHSYPPAGHSYQPEGYSYPPVGNSYPPVGHSYQPEGHSYPPAGHSYQPVAHAFPPGTDVGGAGDASNCFILGNIQHIPENKVSVRTELDGPGLEKERYSNKIFLGATWDIKHGRIRAAFGKFGSMEIEPPYFPAKGFAFIVYDSEWSVKQLIQQCSFENGHYHMQVVKENFPERETQRVEIRPWKFSDAVYVGTEPGSGDSLPTTSSAANTCGLEGLPKGVRAQDVARILEHYFGTVSYLRLATEPATHYPLSTAKAIFTNPWAYRAALEAGFLEVEHPGNKQKYCVQIKPLAFLEPDVNHAGKVGLVMAQSSASATSSASCSSSTSQESVCGPSHSNSYTRARPTPRPWYVK